MSSLNLVTVYTADIVSSREYAGISQYLSKRLPTISHPSLRTGFSLSRGDEIQGVVEGAFGAPDIIRKLRFLCRPYILRIGVGIGPEPANWSLSSWDMTGEAFYRARDALEAARGRKQASTVMRSGDSRFDDIANGLLGLLGAIQSRWTEGQWQAIHCYETEGTYEAAGKALNIAFQNVEKRCRAGRWDAFRSGELTLRKLGELAETGRPIALLLDRAPSGGIT